MHKITLIPGDWIGPETCKVAQKVIAAAGVSVEWDVQPIVDGEVTEELLASCRKNKIVLKSKVASHRNIGELPPTVALRQQLGLWATIRPVRALPGLAAKFPTIDVVVIRETSEDIYSGFEHEVTDGVYEAVKITTPKGCERIARHAYEYAVANNRKEITIAHKSNIMKKSDGLFLEIARNVGAEYPQIKTSEVIVDALCMQLVRYADSFDVILSGNLFGDILSDLCSGLAGGITASPSFSYGDGIAIFETLHGKAPEIVGQNQANPIPILNAVIMMLDYLEENEASDKIQSAIELVIAKGFRTRDMGGKISCSEIAEEIISNL